MFSANSLFRLLETHCKTVIVYGAFAITFGGWWAWNAFLAAAYSSNLSPFDVKYGFTHGFGRDPVWWATFALALGIPLIAELTYKAGRGYVRRLRVIAAREKSAAALHHDGELVVTKPDASASISRIATWRRTLARRARLERFGAEWDVGIWQELEAKWDVPQLALGDEDGSERSGRSEEDR